MAGVIVPDLPVDEGGDWMKACAARDVASVQLAAPGTSDDRLRLIAEASHGFVYCVATYGVTGVRDAIADTGRELVERLRPLTGLPLLLGVGVGTPEQAAQVGAYADGAIVGSALMARLVDGDRAGFLDLVGRFRAALPDGLVHPAHGRCAYAVVASLTGLAFGMRMWYSTTHICMVERKGGP